MTSTDIPDVEWIPKVTAAGLAVITRDRAMLSRRREAAAIVEAGAQMFTIAPTLSIHGDLAGGVSERRKVPLTWENEGVEANILP